jgi:hypothetical protein
MVGEHLVRVRDDEAQHFCSGDLLREYDKKNRREIFL